jgi:hypothetical protein
MVSTAVQLVLDPPPAGAHAHDPPPIVEPTLVVRESTGPAPTEPAP